MTRFFIPSLNLDNVGLKNITFHLLLLGFLIDQVCPKWRTGLSGSSQVPQPLLLYTIQLGNLANQQHKSRDADI